MDLKADLVAAICAEIGVSMIPLGPGSKEKKAVFEQVIDRLELPIGPATKPELARQIAALGGQVWDGSCESTGDTITAVGLERVLSAVRAIRRERGALGSRPRGRIGKPYEQASGGVSADPALLVQDWDQLDAATKEHAELQNEVALLARTHGLQPLSPTADDPPFDVAWWLEDQFVVVEVKSTTPSNAPQQMRLGLGQVLEYRHRLSQQLDATVVPVLVVTSAAHEWAVGTCGAAGVAVAERDRLEGDLADVLRLE